ncbi:polyprenyl synthetase family protein [archaeon]
MDVKEILAKRKAPVMEKVMEFIGDGEPTLLYDMMREYPNRPGKGVRPALVMIATEAYGRDTSQSIITAAALELFQNWVLIHDDIEDESDERRGKPCLHHMHGIPLAINAGDALHIKMWEALDRNSEIMGDEKDRAIKAKMAEMLSRVVEGQTMELSWVHSKNWDVTEEDYYIMIYKKAAWYTTIAPIQFGAIIAGAGNLQAIHDFGEALGKAFQLQDDILNLIADEKYGKEIAGDIYEGKRTLILIHLMKNCSPEEKEKVLAIMNKEREDKTEEEVQYVLGLMKEKGSIDYAIAAAKAYADKAKELFPGLELSDGPATDELKAIVDYIIEREL